MTKIAFALKHSRRLLSCLLLSGMLAGCGNRSDLPVPVSSPQLADYPGNTDPPLLVDAQWLIAAKATAPERVVVLDASDLARYRAGHIVGAVHVWWQDAMDPNAPAYGMLLMPDSNAQDPQRLRRNLIEDLGVAPDSIVVVYDNTGNQRASAIVWTLRFLGYANTSLLDGGLATWLGAGGPTETKDNAPQSIHAPPINPLPNWYLVKDQVMTRLNDSFTVIVDVRTDNERSDTIDGTIGAGTIPGSISIPWTSLIDSTTDLLLGPTELRQVFRDAGVDPGKTIILYGRFGLESTATWIVCRLLGFQSVLLYGGGWAEWAADPATPKDPLVITN